ncbi:GTPase RsgA [Psychrobium sp. nBUS_13]|uniref:GTPase RsgA n=1 Tax=Psychrobium sp. nBUS_13 TaxID=3395319 RepID=UPI003EC10A68
MTTPFSLSLMGWSPTFQQQIPLEEWETTVTARVVAQHRSYVELLSESGKTQLHYTKKMPAITVGDWLLLDQDNTFIRLLERRSEFSRKAAGRKIKAQLIAANIDTVFIVSSLNKDFILSRIERYLALINEAGAEAVIVLTKADLCENKQHYTNCIK